LEFVRGLVARAKKYLAHQTECFSLGLHQYKVFFIMFADDSVGIVSLVSLVKNLEISDIEL
jgi:hypothetical protein